jgi:hypothetical protein
MVERRTKDDSWQLDKHVPIAVIVTVLIQTAYIVWWGSKVDSRVAAIEEHIRKEESKALTMSLPDRMTRLEVQQKYTYEAVNNILIELRSKPR